MADTRFLKTEIEDHVRVWLAEKFAQLFVSKFVPLRGVQGKPRTHEFDAVSEDGSTVCSIKTASWKTSSGKRGAGKVQGAYTELYFLDHAEAKQKYLVLTDPAFFECFKRETEGRLADGLALLHCPLPAELCAEIARIRTASRGELGFSDPE